LINYLNNGGNLYIESTELGKDHSGTGFFDMLGLIYLNDGDEYEVEQLTGTDETMTSNMKLNYNGGASPHYSVDRLGSTFSQMLFYCETGYGRIFLNETTDYKAVSSSVVIGAVANGDSLNLKPYLFSEMVNLFIEYDPYVSVNNNLSNPFLKGNFPNPFTYNTTISYAIEKTGRVIIEVYNANGQMIRKLTDQEMTTGEYSVDWDGRNENGDVVKGGYYFYKITVGNVSLTEKMILVK
jgi:hypothetical protein